jgi:predicted transposase/invertase (TIGR01784 family)
MRQMDDALVEQKRKDDLKKALKEGMQEGAKKRDIEIAKKLLDAKVDIETIKLSTGLTDAELANISKKVP